MPLYAKRDLVMHWSVHAAVCVCMCQAEWAAHHVAPLRAWKRPQPLLAGQPVFIIHLHHIRTHRLPYSTISDRCVCTDTQMNNSVALTSMVVIFHLRQAAFLSTLLSEASHGALELWQAFTHRHTLGQRPKHNKIDMSGPLCTSKEYWHL